MWDVRHGINATQITLTHSLIIHFIQLKSSWNQISSCDYFYCYNWIHHIHRPLGSTGMNQSSQLPNNKEHGQFFFDLPYFSCHIFIKTQLVLMPFPNGPMLVKYKFLPITSLFLPKRPEQNAVILLLFSFLVQAYLIYPAEWGTANWT